MSLQQVYSLDINVAKESFLKIEKLSSYANCGYSPIPENPDNLDVAEYCAVYLYTLGHYSINRKLWETDSTGSALNGAEWNYIRILDMALKKIKNEPQ